MSKRTNQPISNVQIRRRGKPHPGACGWFQEEERERDQDTAGEELGPQTEEPRPKSMACMSSARCTVRWRTKEIIVIKNHTSWTSVSWRNAFCMYLRAYLLIIGGIVYDVRHQNGQQFSHSIDSRCECSIGGIVARKLTSLACSFYPLPGYRVYDIQDS